MSRAVVLALFVCACAGTPPRPRTGAVAADELARFAGFVRDVHPAPFRFVTEDAFAALVDEERARLAALDAPTDLDVGRAVHRVVASIRDAHVQVALPDAPRALLPLRVTVIEGEVMITASAPSWPRGTSVRAIDGVPIDVIREALTPLASADGENDVARARVVMRDFVKLYTLVYGARATYAVTLRAPDGAETTETLAGVDRDAYVALAPAPEPWPTLVTLDADTRLLRLPTFGVPDTAAYEARIAAIVAELEHTTRLVIDLRGNEGGYRTLGAALLSHLADAPYTQWRSSAVAVRALPSRYDDVVAPAFGASLDALRAFPRARTDGLHVRDGDPLAARMTPTAPHLAPALAVLTDGLTNSAANEFALALRLVRPDAVYVGEEIGGGCAGHVGELPVTYTTPTFDVVVLMSLIDVRHVAVPTCARGRGLVPDVPVTTTRACFVAGCDPYVEAARAAL